MLTRSIDADPFGPTFEERIFRNGKRICVGFAVAALGISALDLMNVRLLESGAQFIRDSRLHSDEIPGRILTGIRQISIVPDQASVIVAIPRDAAVAANRSFDSKSVEPRIASSAAAPQRAFDRTPKIATTDAPPARIAGDAGSFKSSTSPVAELAAARHADAVEFAMASPASMQAAKLVSLTTSAPTESAPAIARRPDQVKLASLGPDAQTNDTTNAEPVPATSLPMSTAIPLAMVPLPTPAPGVPPPSPAQRLHLEGKEYAKAERCLANAIYYEARSEPVRGQMAVAQVVINRAFSGFYPNDICGVVYQNANRHLSCQFTFACDGKRKVITERGNWARANRIAKQTLDGQIYVPEVAKSTHYHAVYVHPNWVREMKKMVRYGVHQFYRPFAWGNGAEEPVWGSPAILAAMKKKQAD